MSPNDADRMANSVDPDQTAPLGAVWSGSALFAQAYLSENLGSIWNAEIVSFDKKSQYTLFDKVIKTEHTCVYKSEIL